MYTRNCLIGSGNFRGFLLSLENDSDVIIGEVGPKAIRGVPFIVVEKITKPFCIERRIESKLIDVAPSVGFKTGVNPTEGGKWKIVSCLWNGIFGGFYNKYFFFLV